MQYFGFDKPSFGINTLGFGLLEWLPTELFTGGKQGLWYDPSDIATMFQDAAGTIPVASGGDPVGLILDKSGNNNHATQLVSSARPTYQTNGTLHWLEFDGIDDFLSLGGADMSIAAPYIFNVATELPGGIDGLKPTYKLLSDSASPRFLIGFERTSVASPVNLLVSAGVRKSITLSGDKDRCVLNISVDGLNSSVSLDGTIVDTGDMGANPYNEAVIGRRFINPPDALNFNLFNLIVAKKPSNDKLHAYLRQRGLLV